MKINAKEELKKRIKKTWQGLTENWKLLEKAEEEINDILTNYSTSLLEELLADIRDQLVNLNDNLKAIKEAIEFNPTICGK